MHLSQKQMLLKSSMVVLHLQLGHLLLFFWLHCSIFKGKNLKNIKSIFFLQRNKNTIFAVSSLKQPEINFRID